VKNAAATASFACSANARLPNAKSCPNATAPVAPFHPNATAPAANHPARLTEVLNDQSRVLLQVCEGNAQPRGRRVRLFAMPADRAASTPLLAQRRKLDAETRNERCARSLEAHHLVHVESLDLPRAHLPAEEEEIPRRRPTQ